MNLQEIETRLSYLSGFQPSRPVPQGVYGRARDVYLPSSTAHGGITGSYSASCSVVFQDGLLGLKGPGDVIFSTPNVIFSTPSYFFDPPMLFF